MKYDWIFFDLDNTLMDFSIASHQSFLQLLADNGIRNAEAHYPLYEQVNKKIWRDFEEEKIDAITLRSKRFDDFYRATNIKGLDAWESNRIYLEYVVEYSTMLDGAVELLETLKDKTNLAIITNGLKECQRARMDRLEITDYFKTIVVSDEIGVAKPQAGFFDFAFKECNFPDKKKVLVVGDSLGSDIKGGNDYGLDTCWINPKRKNNTSEYLPNFEIASVKELLPLLS
ncbi:MAG: YjjG family noncanonical pyrimidine nucleotidase [Saprospiraceae bacterium]